MIHLPPRIAAAAASLWALALGATSQIAMPSWGHALITGAGILLAGLGILPDSQLPAE
jgi:hypothetical protein